MKSCKFFSLAILGCALLLGTGNAQIDNFDDGDDDGWQRLDFIGSFIGTNWVTFDASSKAYKITANQTPDAQLGPSRGASLRPNIYSDFWISVDIVDWDPALKQVIGILARVQPNPGIQNTSGYLFSYQPQINDIQISRIVNEAQTYIPGDPTLTAQPQPGEGVRLVFTGAGDTLTGRAYSISDPGVILAENSGVDNFFTEGTSGLLVYDFSDDSNNPITATFDNYAAAKEEPYKFGIIGARIDDGDDNGFGNKLLIDFLSKPGKFYAIEQSSDLGNWLEIDDGIEGATGSDRTTVAVPFVAGFKLFFRLREL